MNIKLVKFTLFTLVIAISSCGGGGSSDSSDNGNSTGEVTAGSWIARADIVSDTCGERIAPVHQVFNIEENGDRAIVDTSIVKITGVVEGGDISAGYQETNGDCVRTYNATFSGFSGNTAQVHFISQSTCSGNSCQSEWAGTATQSE